MTVFFSTPPRKPPVHTRHIICIFHASEIAALQNDSTIFRAARQRSFYFREMNSRGIFSLSATVFDKLLLIAACRNSLARFYGTYTRGKEGRAERERERKRGKVYIRIIDGRYT